MAKEDGKKPLGAAVLVAGIIGGTVIAVVVPYFALANPATGAYGFILAFLAVVLGASAVIRAVAAKGS